MLTPNKVIQINKYRPVQIENGHCGNNKYLVIL